MASVIDVIFRHFFGFLILWQAVFNISNAAISVFMKFFKYFILLLGRAYNSDSLCSASSPLPTTRETILRLLNSGEGAYIEYVVCPKCDSLYEYKDCIKTNPNGTLESKSCCHVAAPNHPHLSRRVACGCVLMKKQKTKKKMTLIPRKVYPYMSIVKSLEMILSRPGYLEKCEQWRSRGSTVSEYLSDVYDGEVWKTFNTEKFGNFLSTPYSYLLCMNVDWFRPFVRGTAYSTGAIYLTIQNLPRNERYRKENIILVGVLPGPKEPKLTMNSYLTPLTEELHQLWQGVIISVKSSSLQLSIRIKAALSCCACDVPASRKVCGFLAHNARLGCNKCLKEFPQYSHPTSIGTCTDYSGFDRDNWTLRTNERHRQKAAELLKEKTITSLQQAESTHGLRYSILLSLPYFDPVQFTVIDPMHNLYLGTGKHAFEVWVKNDLISKKHLANLEEQVKNFIIPNNAGRLPSTIGSGYAGFTANQWSNWITVYSPIVLKGILPDDHLNCWLLFVRACSLLKARVIRKSDIESADLLLLQYCKKFQQMYGQYSITPNMHLHTHLKQCLIDYGPLHAFWCYPFERYNGILGSFHSNRKAIESQLMKKFYQSQIYVDSGIIPSEFAQFLPSHQRDNDDEARSNNTEILQYIHIQSSPLRFISSYVLPPGQNLVKALPPFKNRVLTSCLSGQLQSIYKQLYPTRQIAHMSHFYRQYGRVMLSGDVLGCTMPGANDHSSSVIAAYWPGSGSSLNAIDYTSKRIGVVQHFILHSIEFVSEDNNNLENEKLQHLFCFVYWKKNHPESNWFGVSTIICDDCFEIPDACCFLPIQRVLNKCAYAKIDVHFGSYEDNVLVVCPLPIKY